MQYIAVFDTNILISALLSTNGSPFRCLALAKIGQIQAVTCEEILNEFRDKLISKFQFSQEMAQTAVFEVRSFSRLVEISKELKAVPADPNDDMVIECAVVSGASHIVTGDKHLLALGEYQSIAIIKATELIDLLSQA